METKVLEPAKFKIKIWGLHFLPGCVQITSNTRKFGFLVDNKIDLKYKTVHFLIPTLSFIFFKTQGNLFK